jgi:hypothetical protein
MTRLKRAIDSTVKIKPLWWLRLVSGLVFLTTFLGLTFWQRDATSEQENVGAVLSPSVAWVRTPGTWRLSFVVRSDSMAVSGGVKIRFIRGFHRIQNDDANLPNFVSATTSSLRGSVAIPAISQADPQVPWEWDRNGWVLTVLVQENALYRGDTIYVNFGANPPLGRLTPSPTAYADSVLVAYDLEGRGVYRQMPQRPMIEILPRPPYRVAGFLPTTISSGAYVPLKIVVWDEYDNLATSFTGAVLLGTSDASAIFPSTVEMTPSDSGRKTVAVIFQTPGVHSMQLGVVGRTPDSLWQARTNPAEVLLEAPAYRIFWGDLHSHSSYSHDGHGTEVFFKARDVTCLDFYALTDHTTNDYKSHGGLTPQEWEATRREVIRYYEPGKFVTFPAYEFSAKAPSGHHNVYFKAPNERIAEIPILRDDVYRQVQEIWRAKDNLIPPGIEMLTVPHHTGIIFDANIGASAPLVSFGLGFSNAKLRPLIEIYSTHGLSELYAPQHPLSYQALRPGIRNGSSGPHYAQDAWAAGEILGVIASSDDHSGRPGLPYNGLAAVYATELTRDAVFDALKKRRTYGTTGQRMILHFEINGNLMGSQVPLEIGKYPNIRVEMHGTDDLEFVEVLRWDGIRGQRKQGHPFFETIRWKSGEGRHCIEQFVDSTYSGSSIYYVRVKQKRDIFDSTARLYRQVWAWSSPIWVSDPNTTDTVTTEPLPRQLQLLPTYPNPFGRRTLMTYYLPRDGKVKVTLYNALGQQVRTLLNELQFTGWHNLQLSASGLAHGVYFVRLEAAGEIVTRKIMLMR